MNPIRKQLNDHKWKTHDLESLTLVVIHRGAPNDEAFIHGTEIAEILADGIQLTGEDGAFLLPYHRIKEVRTR
jgi:uncharacterized protein (UPF0248 family)